MPFRFIYLRGFVHVDGPFLLMDNPCQDWSELAALLIEPDYVSLGDAILPLGVLVVDAVVLVEVPQLVVRDGEVELLLTEEHSVAQAEGRPSLQQLRLQQLRLHPRSEYPALVPSLLDHQRPRAHVLPHCPESSSVWNVQSA